ncbi:hypothetical protein GOODEAATRI_008552 [Goodea atripinnis]|uniref:Uncharacterized protein n=1 Tax=Goodea atripinnis TaxID=208336 RepID=A0ABV0NVD1_9TELE
MLRKLDRSGFCSHVNAAVCPHVWYLLLTFEPRVVPILRLSGTYSVCVLSKFRKKTLLTGSWKSVGGGDNVCNCFSLRRQKELPENWTDTRETILEGMTFNLRHFGMTLVDRPKGEQLSAAAVKRIVATRHCQCATMLSTFPTPSTGFVFFSTSYKHFSSETEKLSEGEGNRIVTEEREPLVEKRGKTASVVWKLYGYADSDREQVARNTTNLFNHLKSAHKVVYDQAIKEQREKSVSTPPSTSAPYCVELG